MKFLIYLFCGLAAFIQASTAAPKDNWRCWADPGFAGVIKIDFENKLVCSTGTNGQDYECQGKPRQMDLISRTATQVRIQNQTLRGLKFLAVSKDGKNHLELTVMDKQFPRPWFPQHLVNPANLKVDTGLLGYPSMVWNRPLDGRFNTGDFYCLNEGYFPKQRFK